MLKPEIVDAIWEGVQEKYGLGNLLNWDALEWVVVEGLGTWSDEELIDEATNVGIDPQEFIEEEESEG